MPSNERTKRASEFARRAASTRTPLYDHEMGVKWIPPELTGTGHWEIEPFPEEPPANAIPAQITTVHFTMFNIGTITFIRLEEPSCA